MAANPQGSLPSKDQQIEYLLKHFNFKKVQQAMKGSGHRWMQQQGPATIYFLPTEDQLKEVAVRLLEKCLATKQPQHAGGFVAGFERQSLILTFTIETAGVLVST